MKSIEDYLKINSSQCFILPSKTSPWQKKKVLYILGGFILLVTKVGMGVEAGKVLFTIQLSTLV